MAEGRITMTIEQIKPDNHHQGISDVYRDIKGMQGCIDGTLRWLSCLWGSKRLRGFAGLSVDPPLNQHQATQWYQTPYKGASTSAVLSVVSGPRTASQSSFISGGLCREHEDISFENRSQFCVTLLLIEDSSALCICADFCWVYLLGVRHESPLRRKDDHTTAEEITL